MRTMLPPRADPWRAAAAGERLEGWLAPERVARVAGACAGLGDDLAVRLEFGVDEAGTTFVDVDVEGVYDFVCQRCLGPMRARRRDQARVLIARDDTEARLLETRGEVLVCAPGASLALDALVEDEVLLALPLAPYHPPDEGGPACRAPESTGPAPPDEVVPTDTGGNAEHPFAVLATLEVASGKGNIEQ
jgi:uncharacterized protein